MKLEDKPVARSEAPDEDKILEEYKILVEESRFVMTKYMQALGLYLALMGFGVKEILSASSAEYTIIITFLMSCLNVLTYYGANKFRSMAYHSLVRQTILADYLKMQHPHAMVWGYYAGIACFTIFQILLLIIIILNLCNL